MRQCWQLHHCATSCVPEEDKSTKDQKVWKEKKALCHQIKQHHLQFPFIRLLDQIEGTTVHSRRQESDRKSHRTSLAPVKQMVPLKEKDFKHNSVALTERHGPLFECRVKSNLFNSQMERILWEGNAWKQLNLTEKIIIKRRSVLIIQKMYLALFVRTCFSAVRLLYHKMRWQSRNVCLKGPYF